MLKSKHWIMWSTKYWQKNMIKSENLCHSCMQKHSKENYAMWANIISYRDNKGNAAQKEGHEELKFRSEANLFYVVCHLNRKKCWDQMDHSQKLCYLAIAYKHVIDTHNILHFRYTASRCGILTDTISCVILSISYRKFVDKSGAWGINTCHQLSYT
jgi:hypothetical protein